MSGFRARNIEFIEYLFKTYKVSKCKTWDELSDQISIEKIKESFTIFGGLFPRSLDRFSSLPKNKLNDSKLISVYHGNLDGLTIIDNIARHAIYSDKIIVFHPLQNPANTNPEMDPRIHPSMWRTHFVNCLYF